MDVSLILTHRCNLACGYCYAGEHHKTDIDPDVLTRGVDLLYSDGAERAQLSFFGGEPFLAFQSMKEAIRQAKKRSGELGRELALQCTTNGSLITDEHVRFIRAAGIRVTVSIDWATSMTGPKRFFARSGFKVFSARAARDASARRTSRRETASCPARPGAGTASCVAR